MARLEKLIKRLKSHPKDFTWQELTSLLGQLDFIELQGSGSRVKFFHERRNCLLQLHKPHPSNVLKPYMLKEVVNRLIEEKLI